MSALCLIQTLNTIRCTVLEITDNNLSLMTFSFIVIVLNRFFLSINFYFFSEFSMTASLSHRDVLFVIFGIVILLAMLAISAIQLKIRKCFSILSLFIFIVVQTGLRFKKKGKNY